MVFSDLQTLLATYILPTMQKRRGQSEAAVIFLVSLTFFFDFVTWLPFTEMHDAAKKWPSHKVEENCDTNVNLNVHCVM